MIVVPFRRHGKTRLARHGRNVQEACGGAPAAAGRLGGDVVSREVGVSVATLERWQVEALADPAGDQGGAKRWTAVARWRR
jgi:hypothetical protein